MHFLKYLTFLLFFFFLTNRAEAYTYGPTISLGNLCEFIGKMQTDDNGATNSCSFNPYFATSLDIPVTSSLFFSPELGLTLPKKGRDENISKISFFALANTKTKVEFVHFIAGVGFYFTRISANGGTEELNNGNTTSSFPLPDGAVISRNFIVNAGLGIDFSKDLSADVHTYVFNLVSSQERAFSVLINGTYHFGEF